MTTLFWTLAGIWGLVFAFVFTLFCMLDEDKHTFRNAMVTLFCILTWPVTLAYYVYNYYRKPKQERPMI